MSVSNGTPLPCHLSMATRLSTSVDHLYKQNTSKYTSLFRYKEAILKITDIAQRDMQTYKWASASVKVNVTSSIMQHVQSGGRGFSYHLKLITHNSI